MKYLHLIVLGAVLAIVAGYIAFAIVPGPRRVDTGLGWPIAITVVLFGLGLGALRPRRLPYVVGMITLIVAFAVALAAEQLVAPGPGSGWFAFPIALGTGSIALGASVWSWRGAIAAYLALGAWTIVQLVLREGPDYLPDHINDADSMFWSIVFPLTMWPEITFGMLGAFGIVQH